MRASDFKRTWQLATAALFTLTLLIMAACGEDEPQADPVTVQFGTAAQTIAEDGGAKNITLSLSSAATKDGTISLSASPANANTFATFPAEIVVTKGSTSAQFTLTPINNAVIDDGPKVITFTLGNASSGFKLGTQITHAVTITDDEGPTTANFAIASGSVGENASAGIEVVISLSSAADVAGSIQVTMTPSDAAVTTTPAAAAGVITVPVAVGENSVSFTVVPVDNDDDGEDVEVDFEITGTSGEGINLGTNLDYTLTIVDNDDVEPTPIADVRALYSGTGTQDITTPLLIQGIITSINPQVNTNNIWVQDETGGIVVRFKNANNNTLERGDEVLIDLMGARFNNFSGLMQVENVENEGTVTVVDKNNTLPTPEVVTFTQLKTDNYQGKLVAVENVSFVDADGILTMNGTRAITDGTETVNVRTESGAPFSGSAIPLGSGTVKGLAGINAGVVQIIPMVFAEDVFANDPVGTIDVTQSLVDFGSVDNGNESAEQSYTVQGTTLTHDLIVTASPGYEVSLTSGSGFASSVTILAASANSSTTIYVKFAPASGVNGVINGSIAHKSQGAATVEFDVTGTESGNAASDLTLEENFNYGGSDNADITAVTSTWVRHSGAAGPQYSATGLTYTGHPASGVGGAIGFTFGSSGTNDGDAHRVFSKFEGNGDVYVSFLIDLSAARATSDYFFHVGQNVIGSNFRARLHARSNGAGWSFGLQKNGETRVDNTTVLNFNQTYLVVLKYSINTATATDDLVTLYVFDSGIPVSEPGSPLITIGPTGDGGASDIADIGSVAVRQSGNSPTGKIDAIRVSDTWADLFE